MNHKKKHYSEKPSKKKIDNLLQWYAALAAANGQQLKTNEKEVNKK